MARPNNHSVFSRVEGLPIILVFAVLLGIFMFTAPQVFLAPNIYTTFLTTLPPLIILSVGLTFVIGAGEIDLSFPSVIAFSGFVVVIAALNLVLDFDFIENGVEQGAPKYMEWYAAFGLLVTLVWLYLEILRLLGKLQSRD